MTTPVSKLTEAVFSYIGVLCGAAWKDIQDADPADVDMGGVPIRAWRKAYYEGCKDMGNGILNALPEEHQPYAKAAFKAAFDKEKARSTLPNQETK